MGNEERRVVRTKGLRIDGEGDRVNSVHLRTFATFATVGFLAGERKEAREGEMREEERERTFALRECLRNTRIHVVRTSEGVRACD